MENLTEFVERFMLKDMRMKQIKYNKSRGMTLTELLAVLMIISLLATIAVPVYVNRQEDAREGVAQGETREIANAEDMVATMVGFYVPFQLLDDLPADLDNLDPDEERIDRNPFADTIFLINPTVRAEDQFLNNTQPNLNDGYQQSQLPVGDEASVRVNNFVQGWSGPYLSFQRFWYDIDSGVYDGPTDPDYRNSNDMFRDFPLDPWGNPYRFYSPIGIIGDAGDDSDFRGDNFNYANPDLDFSNGELTRNDEERFQRYAVVSFGRDGIADTDPNIIDPDAIDNDVYYEFGTDGLPRNFGRF